MANYSLKNKIQVTKDFTDELIAKSWQDIESIKNQINSIDDTSEQGLAVIQLLTELLTSFYIFTGCLENLEITSKRNELVDYTATDETDIIEQPSKISNNIIKNSEEVTYLFSNVEQKDDFEPFEYFVDFDEPVGEKLTDEDLYKI